MQQTTHSIPQRNLLKSNRSRPGEKQAPGPKGHFLLGSLPERRSDPLNLFLKSSQQYGDIVRFNFAGITVHLINHPDFIRQVLIDNTKNYIKGFGYDKLTSLLGQGLLTNDGESWRRQRKLAQPAFHREHIIGFAKTITDCIAEMHAEIDRFEGKPFDIHKIMYPLTLRVISLTMLGQDVSRMAEKVSQALDYLIEAANERILSVFDIKYRLPLPSNQKYRQAIQIIDEVVYDFIQQRRKCNESELAKKNDLLSMLMSARDEETGQGMSDKQLHDEVMTIFLAGHETTANALSFAWYLLSKNPSVARKVRDEANLVLQNRTPEYADYPKLKYTRMVVDEAMRIYPPAWVFSRQAVSEDTIGGYTIPKGSIVVMSPYVLHRNEKFWNNPEGFDPERFDESSSNHRPKLAYLPFSAGPRQCIGNNFALLEAVFTVALTIQKYDLSLVPGFNLELEPLITLRPKNGIWFTARKNS